MKKLGLPMRYVYLVLLSKGLIKPQQIPKQEIIAFGVTEE